MIGKDALKRLDDFLAEHPSLSICREEGSTTVRAIGENGFDVKMVDDGFHATIYALDWRGRYEKGEEAAASFMWLLSPKTRIVRRFCGPNEVGWKLQWEEDGKWITGDRGVSLLAFLAWGRRREEILQNDLA